MHFLTMYLLYTNLDTAQNLKIKIELKIKNEYSEMANQN